MDLKPQHLRETIVHETGIGRYTQKVIIGPHIFTADEPKQNGGNDSGPSPYDFLLAALGSCTSMTVRMYAELKNLPLEQIHVTLKHEKIHVEDCTECENNNSKIDRIELKGALSQEQRVKLLEIANKCPVHRTLTSKILIETELLENHSNSN